MSRLTNLAAEFTQDEKDPTWTTRFTIAGADGSVSLKRPCHACSSEHGPDSHPVVQVTAPPNATQPAGEAIPWGVGRLASGSASSAVGAAASGASSSAISGAASSASDETSTATSAATSGSAKAASAGPARTSGSASSASSSGSKASQVSQAAATSAKPTSGATSLVLGTRALVAATVGAGLFMLA